MAEHHHRIDHTHTDNIVCPHCGEEIEDSYEFGDQGEEKCDLCEQTFTYERHVEITYTTAKKSDA